MTEFGIATEIEFDTSDMLFDRTHRPLTSMARHLTVLVLAMGLGLGGSGLFAGAASATEPDGAEAPAAAGPAVDDAQLRALVSTLEDEQSRERLVGDIKALLLAAESTGRTGGGKAPGASALQTLSDGMGRAGDEIIKLAEGIGNLPKAIGWVVDQWSADETRGVWVDVLWKLAVVIAGGFIAAIMFRFALRKPRRALETRPRPKPWLRPFLLLSYNLMSVVPALGFAGAGYGLLTVLDPAEVTRLIGLSLINAHVTAAAIKAASGQGLAPHTPNLRVSGISDITAHYCNTWWRRLVNITVYGYFVCQAAVLLGLPEAGYSALLTVLGLIVVGLLITLILQNRLAFATWVREGTRERRWQGLFRLLARVADFWHVLAILYVIAGGMITAASGLKGFLFFGKSSAASFAIVWAMGFLLMAIQKAVDTGFTIKPELAERYPGLQERVSRYLPVAKTIMQVVVIIVAVIMILEAWNVDVLTWLATEAGGIVIGKLAAIAVIVVIAVLVWEAISAVIDRYLNTDDSETGEVVEQSQRARTLPPLARRAARIAIWVVAALMILDEVGIDNAPILAGVGVIGLAVGFGAQTLVKDIITGVFILAEDSIAVGDVVTVGARTGVVEAISIRTVKLRDLSGNVHTVPFSAIDTVTNMTKEFSYYLIEAGVAYRENVDEVIDIMRAVGDDLQTDSEFGPNILEPIEVMGLDRCEDSAVVIRARLKTVPVKQWATGREYNRRLKAAFDEKGIEIPFPHQTIYFGEDKQGLAPAAMVRLVAQGDEPKAADVRGSSAGKGGVDVAQPGPPAKADKPRRPSRQPRAAGQSEGDDGDNPL